jgi:hypothetical protein
MMKGNTTCTTHKAVLGWILDTLKVTIELLSHHITHLFEILDGIVTIQGCTLVKKWQQLLGDSTPW